MNDNDLEREFRLCKAACESHLKRIAQLEAQVFKLVEGANKTALEYEERIAELEAELTETTAVMECFRGMLDKLLAKGKKE